MRMAKGVGNAKVGGDKSVIRRISRQESTIHVHLGHSGLFNDIISNDVNCSRLSMKRNKETRPAMLFC